MKGLFIAFLLLGSSAIMGLGAIEGVLRIFSYYPAKGLLNGRELILRPSSDPDLEYELTPGATGTAWHTRVKINSSGFRGPEFSKTANQSPRIVVLGDSVAFGNGLQLEQTFPDKLEQLLSSEHPDAEVLNLAVGGYDTLQEAALLETKGVYYRPDIVVVAYCLNDIAIASENLRYIEMLRTAKYQQLLKSRLVQLLFTKGGRLWQISRLGRLNSRPDFLQRYNGQIDPITVKDRALLRLMRRASDQKPSHWYKQRFLVGRLRHAFGRLEALKREHGFEVVVMIIPWLTTENGDYPHQYAHRIVAHEARRARLLSFDLTEVLLRQKPQELRIHPRDPAHPNAHGHTLIAQALSTHLNELLTADRT